MQSDTQKTGTNALINVDVTWTDSSKQQSIGQHDVYMLAVDKGITLLEGDNDINPARVSPKVAVCGHCPVTLSLTMKH